MHILSVKCEYEGRTRLHVSYLKLLTRFRRNQVEPYAAFPKYITFLLLIFRLSVISLSIHDKVLRGKKICTVDIHLHPIYQTPRSFVEMHKIIFRPLK